MGAGEVDLGRAYYDAIVKHAREPDAAEAMDADDAQPAPAPVETATLEEEAACQLALATKQQTHTALYWAAAATGKIRGKNGSGVFSERRRDPNAAAEADGELLAVCVLLSPTTRRRRAVCLYLTVPRIEL